MIDWPWNIVLTIAFVFSGVVCLSYLVIDRLPGRHGHSDVLTDTAVNVNHAVMSVGMIIMAWIPVTVAGELQTVVFSLFGLVFLALLWRVRGATARIDLIGHVVLNAAMVWMIVAMPLLMAEMMAGMPGDMPTGAASTGDMAMAAGTPAWVDAVNLVFVVLSAAVGAWQLYRLASSRHHRVHAACHAVMALGMAAMLVLMN